MNPTNVTGDGVRGSRVVNPMNPVQIQIPFFRAITSVPRNRGKCSRNIKKIVVLVRFEPAMIIIDSFTMTL